MRAAPRNTGSSFAATFWIGDLRLYIVVRPCLGNMKIKATIRGRIGLLEQEIKA
jgi:hypothetical protein